MAETLKDRLQEYVDSAVDSSSLQESNGEKDSKNGSFEETSFNIIKMIKSHLSHSTPLMFHVVAHYSRFRRGGFNRLFFWVLAYIGQVIDMLFSIAYGIIMLFIAVIVVVAIARGVGLGDYFIEVMTNLRAQ